VDALEVRVSAAHDLVDKGLLDGMLALSYVIFPSEAVETASEACADPGGHRGWTAEHRQEARRLQAEGLSWSQIAERVCGDKRFKSTVQTWLRGHGRKGE
jgi:hypothetical protein